MAIDGRAAVTVAMATLLASGVARAQSWPDVPTPEGAQGEWVSQHMRYNGLNMRAMRFQVRQKLDVVESFYRKAWGTQVVKNALGRKTVLGHAEGRYFITVELTPSGSSTQGQIGIMQMPTKAPAGRPGDGFSKMPGTQVNEDIVYLDTPQKSRSLNMFNGHSPFQNDRFYKRVLAGKGYVRESRSMACNASSQLCVAYYQKGDDRIVVSMNRMNEGTSIVALDL